jgi:hypothetical protein
LGADNARRSTAHAIARAAAATKRKTGFSDAPMWNTCGAHDGRISDFGSLERDGD